MDILAIDDLQKSFGSNKVINGLSFSVPEHSVFGFIGQNGAGKTTTMKMILGLLRSDSGNITVCGDKVSFGQTATNKYVGYLPDVPEFYSYMRPKEYLRLCGEITGMTADKISGRSNELLGLVGLGGVNKKIGSFSRGMKQRLGIAQALLNEPRLLICDEPTSALDPVGRKEILDILLAVRGKTTVIFSTHILTDVERICDRVAVLHKGRAAFCGTLPEFKSLRKANNLILEFAADKDRDKFLSLLGSADTELSGTGVTVHTDNLTETQTTVMELLYREKLLPLKIEVAEPNIESIFMGLIN